MKIGILGTRGIPNNYGGFEQFAEFFSIYAAQAEHSVFVYTPHNHTYKENTFEKVNLIKCYDPEYVIGTAGQFIYDLNCILDSRKRNFDIILQLGYTSSAFWYDLHPKNSIVITNMDGLEWKRTKYNKPIKKLLKIAERMAATKSDYLISDSLGIQEYLLKTHNKESEYIAYGADNFDTPNEEFLNNYKVEKYNFNMIMARFEPENNLNMVLEGVMLSKDEKPILVIGNHKTKYGDYLKNKFSTCKKIKFLGAIYNLTDLNNLRYFSNLYFHGHTVGGTNPSLLEAMASQGLIAAHRNQFNYGVLKENAFYFENSLDVKKILETIKKIDNLQFVKNNSEAIANNFNWNKINDEYLQFFSKCLARNATGAKVK
jgi:glycosyltransferase involved in cell wall biosynthesis